MRLELLVSVLCVVWGSAYSQTVCRHDGYFDGTLCICKPGFSGASCEKRECTNNGFSRSINKGADFGCICPPGFIGPNCQGTKCVAGDSKAFYDGQSDKMISLYLTYNMDLRKKISSSNDNPVDTICGVLGSSQLYQLMVSTGDSDSIIRIANTNKPECLRQFNEEVSYNCVANDEETPIDCPGSVNITISQISTLLSVTSPNSQLFIVTNYPLSDCSDSDIQSVIKLAVSRRIRINTLTFAAPGVMDYVKYQEDPGYQAFRTLSESTLGVYVTPYRGTADSLMGQNKNSEVAQKLLDLWTGGYEAAGVFSTKQVQPQFLNVGTDDYYIHVRSRNDSGDTTFFNWRKQPDGTNVNVTELDTGYWKMWRGKGSDKSISFIMGDLNQIETNFVILAKSTVSVYPAITTADNVDASSPFLDMPSGPRSFVGKLVDSNWTPSFPTSFFYPSGAVDYTSPQNSSRSSCQFSTNLGNVQCKTPGVSYFQLRTTTGVGSATPFYCGGSGTDDSPNSSSYSLEISDFVEESQDDTTCTDDGSMAQQLLTSNQNRNFVIISRNVRELDEKNRSMSNSPSDNLYLNKGNIFSYMLKQANAMQKNPFQYFVYNLVDTGSETNTSLTMDKNDFMDNIVSAVLSARQINATLDDGNTGVSWKTAIKDTAAKLSKPLFQAKSTGFSDVFVVIDYAIQTEFMANDTDLLTELYTTRSRLFILLLETYDTFNETYRNDLSRLAALTGGGLFRFENYTELQNFFGAYFTNDGDVGLFQADTVYQLYYSKPKSLPFFTTDAVYLNKSLNSLAIDYTLLVDCLGTAVTVSTNDNIILNETKTFGETRLYSLKNLADGQYSFKISFLSLEDEYVNVLILATTKNGPIPANSIVAFSSSPTTSVDQFVLKFAQSLEPVISQGSVTQFSLKNPSNQIVYSQPPIQRGDCSGFPSLVDYKFQCTHPNDIYYFQTTFSDNNGGNHSRTFMTQCLSSKGGCLNGGKKEGDVCVCAVGFTGEYCQYPICENGGNVTSSYLCECDTAAGYSGFFCEISNNTCTGSPAIPDARSEVTSLIFVVEKTGNDYLNAVKPTNLPGVQLAVVQYDCDGVYPTQLATDVSKLPAALNTALNPTNCTNNSGNSALALITALNSQVTDRAVIVFITSDGFTWNNQRQVILNQLASQRADLRLFTNGTSDELNLLAAFGNGIPFVSTAEKFGDYYSDYISKIFSVKAGNNARLSVLQSGSGPVNVTIFADPADSSPTYFVHSNCTVTGPALTTTVTGVPTLIQTGTFNGDVTVRIPCDGPYSIEKLTTIQLAFGFQTSSVDEHLQLGLSQGTNNVLSLKTSLSIVGDDLTQMPTISLTPIYGNGTSSETLYLTAKKNDTSCMYPSYSMPITCNDIVLGYSAIIHTFTTSKTPRQEQKMLACFNGENDPAFCKNGGSITDGVCSCSSGWEGLQCDIPSCSSTGVLNGGICMCSPGYSGPTCSTNDFEIAPNASKAFVFIVDSRGADDNLYGMSITSITDFLSMYDDSHIVFMISNTGQYTGTFVPNKKSAYQAQIDYLLSLRDNTNERQDFTLAFDNIQKETKAASENSHVTVFSASASLNNIFYTGLTGVSLQNKNSFKELQSLYSISSLYYVATDPTKMVAVNKGRVEDDQQSITDNLGFTFKLVTNAGDALNFMKDETKGAIYTTPTPLPARSYSCVKGSLANIFLSVEVSNVKNMDAYQNKTVDILKGFPSDFEQSSGFVYQANLPNGSYDLRGCTVNNDRFDGQSLISGWKFSSDKCIMGPGRGFCYSSGNYGALLTNVEGAAPDTSGTPNWNSLMPFFKMQLGTCYCSRMNDTNVANIVLWIAVTNGTGADPSILTQSPYLHFVVPFGFKVENGSFYDELVQSNSGKKFGAALQPEEYILSGAEETSANDIVQQLWTKLCKLQGLIGSDGTAAPPTIGEEEMFKMERFYAAERLREL